MTATSNAYVYIHEDDGRLRAHSNFSGPDDKARMCSGDSHDELPSHRSGRRIHEGVAVPRHSRKT
jgi:hypothetical protein